jgi:hypothetical protein
VSNHAAAEQFRATFSGFEEIGTLITTTAIKNQTGQTGAILSKGTASLFLNLDKQAGTLEFTLIYRDVGTTTPNTGAVTQAHIHFGQHHVAGGIIVWLCGTTTNPGPSGTPTCPDGGGTVTSKLMAADVVGPTAQNIPAGDFDGLVAALEHDTAYGNIHTTFYTAGEIRGQIKRCEDDNCLYNLPPAGSGNGQGNNGQGNQN